MEKVVVEFADEYESKDFKLEKSFLRKFWLEIFNLRTLRVIQFDCLISWENRYIKLLDKLVMLVLLKYQIL